MRSDISISIICVWCLGWQSSLSLMFTAYLTVTSFLLMASISIAMFSDPQCFGGFTALRKTKQFFCCCYLHIFTGFTSSRE